MKRLPNLLLIAAGAAVAAGLTADLTESELFILFCVCVVGIGWFYVSEVFRRIKG